MTLDSISQISDALASPELKAGHLHACWERRQPVPDAAHGHKVEDQEATRQIPWLQGDLALVQRFAARALEKDEFLLVCDVAREAQRLWPQADERGRLELVRIRMSYAEALTRLGAYRHARELLEPCLEPTFRPVLAPELRVQLYLQIGHILREESHEVATRASRLQIADDALASYQHALELAPENLEALVLTAAAGLITSVEGTPRRTLALERARRTLQMAAHMEGVQGPCIPAATARAFALTVLGRLDEAAAAYTQLAAVEGATTALLAETRHRAQYLAEALDLPRRYFHPAFPPLQLIVFAGHLPDRPGEPARFPAAAVPAVRALLRQELAVRQVRAALVCAAAGADLLFFEALRERGGLAHVVLPWERGEFRRTSVLPYERPEEPLWEALFDRALQEAETLREEGHLFEPSSGVGWEYLSEVIVGMALHTARVSRLDIQPMVLWDGQPGHGPGGTESFVHFWRRQLRQEPIHLPMPVPEAGGERIQLGAGQRVETPTLHQEVKSMIFADIVGYSKLTEKVIPEFITTFLERLSQLVARSAHAPRSVNTWGDAIYAVFDYAYDAGCFALELVQMVQEGRGDWLSKGLYWEETQPGGHGVQSHPLNIRVGLHTGPVFLHYDPVVRRLGFTGAHVNRAARIEPVAEPGEVFASEEFASLAELNAEIQARQPGAAANLDGFVCEYAGTLHLAKNFPGRHRIYRVLPRRTFALEELARAAHESYCEKARARGDTPATHPALRPWDELPEDVRNANRAQVAHIPAKLARLGYELAHAHGLAPSQIEVSREQLEELAIIEHDRWMAERARQGWTFAPVRDNARKYHPLMVPWEALSEVEKDKDRDTVRNMPWLIELAGFRVRRLQPRPGGW